MNLTPSFTAYTGHVLDFINRTALSGSRRSEQTDSSVELESDQEFNRLALELFQLQFQNVEPFRLYCHRRAATPATVAHWTMIPSVPASAFKEFELTSLATSARTQVFHSSGTTDQRPSRHFHDTESLRVYEASLKPWFATHLLEDPTEPLQMIFLTPPPERVPHSSLVHMLQVVGTAFGAPGSYFAGSTGTDHSWMLDDSRVFASLHDATLAGHPVMLLGTAFSFVHLLDEFAAQNLRLTLPTGSRVMETGGYKGRSRQLPKTELHALIRNQLGVPESHIICEYGMSELSSQAYAGRIQKRPLEAEHVAPVPASNDQTTFSFPPWVRTMVVSPETNRPVAVGEQGLIRIFDLANVRSILAIQTEDLAELRKRGFELLGRSSLSEPRGCSLMAS